MKKKATPETKVCNRCKIEKDKRKCYKNRNIERVSGLQHWTHPWCYECRATVKEVWGTNWIGGKKNEARKEKDSTSISSIYRRTTNKTNNTKRSNQPVSKHTSQRGKTVVGHRKRTSRVHNNSKSGSIVKTLRKTKDYEGE